MSATYGLFTVTGFDWSWFVSHRLKAKRSTAVYWEMSPSPLVQWFRFCKITTVGGGAAILKDLLKWVWVMGNSGITRYSNHGLLIYYT